MKLAAVFVFSGLLLLCACGSEDPAKKGKGTGGAADVVAGAAYFKKTCVNCHGEKGQADGPASGGLVPKPRDLSDKAWQATIDDDYLRKVIQYGGTAVGKSAVMVGNPDLAGKDELLNGVVQHVRSLAK